MVLLDEGGTMQVFQKNGTLRFPKKEFNSRFRQPPMYQVLKNSARIVACDTTGKVFVTNLSGDGFQLSVAPGKVGNVGFAFSDVAGDERNEYISLGGKELAVFGYQGSSFKKLAGFLFENPPSEVFGISWRGAKKAYIGTVDKTKKQIHLLDGEGRLLPQFPLAGDTPFTVVDLAGDGKAVVIVGNGDSVYAYSLE
jgi:hypothetical protein